MSHIKIMGWEKLQHYKTRNPPWIRLYRGLIDDPEDAYRWRQLSDGAAKLLIEIWLTACKSNPEKKGCLHYASSVLADSLHRDEGEMVTLIKELIKSKWLEGEIEDASNLLAECKQLASKSSPLHNRTEHNITETEGAEKAKTDHLQQTFIVIPLMNDEEYVITRKEYYRLIEAYPKIDVAKELVGLREHALKKGTYKDGKAYIANNLESARKKANNNQGYKQKTMTERSYDEYKAKRKRQGG